jgi:hypothetical protein
VRSDAGVVGLKGAGIHECSFVYASKKSLAFPVNSIHEIHKCPATQFSHLVLNFTQNQTRTVESVYVKAFTHLSKAWVLNLLIFT